MALPANPNGPIYGTSGNDVRVGTFEYSDTMFGRDGHDQLHGRFGADYLDGGNGNDKLYGDAGDDWLVGGKGNDQFVFAWQMGKDTIQDFKVAGITKGGETDSIHLYDLYSNGQWFETDYKWLDPSDVNGDGNLDAVLQVYSQDWINYVNADPENWSRWDPAQGEYTAANMKDTVTLLGWGGDVNGDGKLGDYNNITIVEHAHNVDGGYLFI